jgi:hypothetical protein
MTVKNKVKSVLDPDLEVPTLSEEARRQVLEGIPRLEALRERIRAKRGGKPIPEDVLTAALHEARAAHERGE